MKKQTITADPGKEKTGSKILGTVINIILVLAIILAFICTYTSYTTKKGSGVPNILGFEPFSIQTNSMSPFFVAGDLVIDKSLSDYSDLEEGQIITFWTIIDGEKVLNTHRIVEAVKDEEFTYYYTKGDANTREDSLTVHQSEIVGVYLTHLKGVGNALDFMQTSKGFFIIVVLPVFAFFLYYMVSFFRVLFEYQGEKKRLELEREFEARNTQQGSSEPVTKVSENNNETSETITMTKEQLMDLLQKAELLKQTENASKEEKEG